MKLLNIYLSYGTYAVGLNPEMQKKTSVQK